MFYDELQIFFKINRNYKFISIMLSFHVVLLTIDRHTRNEDLNLKMKLGNFMK